MSVKIVWLSAYPFSARPLHLEEEIRDIDDFVRKAAHRDRLKIDALPALRPEDLIQVLNDYQPNVVHFSGHGIHSSEIVFMDQNGNPVPARTEEIATVFQDFKQNVKLVVLSGCYSQAQAEALVQHIPCVVGMNAVFGERAAITFNTSFYRAIGSGYTVLSAFNQGRIALDLAGIPITETPILCCRGGVDADRIVFVEPRHANRIREMQSTSAEDCEQEENRCNLDIN